MIQIEWGIKPPEGAEVAWGARAIYSLREERATHLRRSPGRKPVRVTRERTVADVGLLPDRQSCAGGSEVRRRELCREIDRYLLPRLRQKLVEEFVTPECHAVVEVQIQDYVLRASPRGSYGYLYLGAWPAGARSQVTESLIHSIRVAIGRNARIEDVRDGILGASGYTAADVFLAWQAAEILGPLPDAGRPR